MKTHANRAPARSRVTNQPLSETPCPSCPFLETNFAEFAVVAEKLCAKFGKPKPDFWACLSIRENVKADAIKTGVLQCHATVYDAQMNPHPEGSRPCAGLALHLRKMG